MSTESGDCNDDECRVKNKDDDDVERNLVIDTEETPTCTPLNAKVTCTSDGVVYVVESEEHSHLSHLFSQSDIVAEGQLWPKIRYLYRSTSTEGVVDVYKSVDSTDHPFCAPTNNEHLLICFLCNLSFSSPLSFLCHVTESQHHVRLSSDEKRAILLSSDVTAVLQSFDNNNCSTTEANCVVSILTKDGEKTFDNITSGVDEIAVATDCANSEPNGSSTESAGFGQPSSLAYCSLHPEGKTVGVECPKCDVVLGSSRSLGGHMTMMHSRNSCKTLKCPKCNWHYKYQETLEIHMKEKHSDVPTTCPYCVSNIPHPRLGRGEQWSCGYKPFRCDVCKYSTTTKGNLAIHMQSDKHLNNVQEQQTDFLTDSAGVLGHQQQQQQQSSSTNSSDSNNLQNFNSITSTCSSAANKIKPVLRCDVCNYETNVARNLRIHMTSEKHASNVVLRQQSVKQYQQHNFLIPPSPTSTDLNHFRTNLCQLTPFTTPSTNLNIVSAEDLNSSLALSLQNSYLQHALDEENLYQCCVCMNFVCDSVDELIQHCQNVDRSQPNDGDVSVMAGNYLCNLCNYKTHLKANFQLHTKTDKHLQRLQLVNHIREGGAENELRMKYLNLNNPVQLRCVACNEFANSFHKIQMHTATMRHKSFVESFRKISSYSTPSASQLYCSLCGFVTKAKRLAYAHLHCEQHNELANQFLPVMEASSSVACWIEIRDDLRHLDSEQEEGFELSDVDGDAAVEEDEEDEDERCCNSRNNNNHNHHENHTVVETASSIMTDGAHCCSRCTFTTSDVREFCKHVCDATVNVKNDDDEDNEEENNSMNNNMQIQKFLCPLCQIDCGCNKERLECHLSQIHNVSNEVIKSLMNLLPTSANYSDLNNEQKTSTCPLCSAQFSSADDLYAHQSDAGHTEVKTTAEGPSYLCWWKGCNQYFKSPLAVQNHFREIHNKIKASASTSSPSCVTSDRHAYRFRCTQCSLAFISEDKLRAHQQYHVIRAATKCAICGRTFRSTVALKKHVETTHINLNAAELLQYKAQLMSNDDDTFTNVVDDSGQRHLPTTEENNCAATSSMEMSVEDKLEEHLNSVDMAVNSYNDPSRKFKCHKCKMSFTKQTFLSIHNRTLQHRRGEKSPNYNVERYNDPSRPFKCEVCKESFTQKSILLVHLNSVLHLHKMKKANAYSPSSIMSSSTNGKLPSNLTTTTMSSDLKPTFSTSTGSSSSRKTVKQELQQTTSKDFKPFQLPVSSLNPNLDNSFASLFNSFKNNMTNGGDNVDLTGAFGEPSAKQLVNDMIIKKQQQNSLKASNASASLLSPSLVQQMQQQSAAALLQMASLAPFFDTLLPFQGQKNEETNVIKSEHNVLSEDINRKLSATSPSEQHLASKNGRATLTKPGRVTFKRLLEDYGFEVVMQYNESSSLAKKRNKIIDEQQPQVQLTQTEDEMPLTKKPKIEPASSPTETENQDGKDALSVPEITRCICIHCGNSYSSVWVLKAHVEQVHRELIPLGEVEKLSEEFKQVYEKKHPVTNIAAEDSPVQTQNVPSVNSVENVKPKQHATQQQQQQQQQSLNNMMGLAAMGQAPVTPQAAAAAAAAMSLSLGLGMQFPFVGMPFTPFGAQNPFLPMMIPQGFEAMNYPSQSQASTVSVNASGSKQFSTPVTSMAPTAMVIQQQQKRARTRITDDQLKILREYFDINNSPTEEQIEQMSLKSGLPQKVIKHWFRNTLFKERQRSKDSPYNFNIPPSLGIDLEEYEKTGEAKVIPLNPNSDWPSATSSNSVVINCGEPEPVSEKSVAENHADQVDNNIKPELGLPENLNSAYHKFLDPIKEERPDSVDDSVTSQDGQLDDFSRERTPSFSESNYLSASAQETFRRLTQSIPRLQPFNNSNISNQFNFLNPKSSSSTSQSGQDLTSMITNALSPNTSLTAAGRRANRTRFTEWQVKMLQDFFEKNAYPKDDDLENLSKTLNLSPRVIVVWFQNARQKARKVYENLPQENDDRFLRTPGLNYQCKKCNLVFQRYYELIKHQKSLCFKDENIGLNGEFSKKTYLIHNSSGKTEATSPTQSYNSNTSEDQGNKSQCEELKCEACNIHFTGQVQFEEHVKVHANNPLLFTDIGSTNLNLSSPGDTQHRQSLNEGVKTSSSSGEVSPDTTVTKRQRTQILPEQLELLYETYRKDSKPSVKVLDQISAETGLSKRVVQVWFQNTRMRERRGQVSNEMKPLNNVYNSSPKFFNKRCPFCGILFHSKPTMDSHLTSKHPAQYMSVGVDIDALPDAEEVPTITTVPLTEALWNAFGSSTDSSGIAQSMLSIGVPTMVPGTTTVDSNYGQKPEISSIVDRIATGKANAEETPLDLSRALKQMSADKNLITEDFRTRQTPSAGYSNEDEISSFSLEDDDMQSNNSQDSPSPHHQVLAALTRPQKRFRTHLTLQQIKVMKHLFQDFKTPTMAECEALGNEIGLYKRVVQVWFQNARAKERKVKVVGGSNSDSCSPDTKPTSTKCSLCNVPYSGRINMQDHSFSKSHIDKIKQTVDDPLESGGQFIIDVNDDTYTRASSNGQSSSKASSVDHSTTYASHESTVGTSTSSAKLSTSAQKHSQSPQPSRKKTPQDSNAAAMAVAQNLLPYMYSAGNPAAAYYASMMMPAGFGGLSNSGLFYDPNLHGTPVNLLQIPPNIMQTITSGIQRCKESSCRFTQDGKTVADLVKVLDAKDKNCVVEKDLEVGWACRRCVTVFQAEHFFLNHQHLICQSKESPFKLIQTHYDCTACNQWFGTQVDFKKHCELPEHSSKVTAKRR